MLKSFIKEIIGASTALYDPCPSLVSFRNKCHVLVLFEGSADDRCELQEEYLANQHEALASRDIALLRVAGGGVFSSFEACADISADQIRADLNGPSPEEFEAILVGPDGAIKFRSGRPVSVQHVVETMDRLPHSNPVAHA
ncbi:hypothetical protein J2W42_005168 [Rhizobium tibeticum]|uniref:DUF4174 domain-containing protein n=1 Tax=Rhizobium tibeticum TaxID=501024 RepID=UPI0027837FEE|nr:DUF4174 domain-containing protein [Rhizobium tibeticum]MDP9812298.1 hypothetical protein [Rhizobium tibeticum]